LIFAEHCTKAYLDLIRGQESSLCKSTYCLGIESLKLINSSCLTSDVPQNKMDTVVKELLKYRLLDVAALIYDKAPNISTIGKGPIPFVEKLVRLFTFSNHYCFEMHTGQGGLGDWPTVVLTATASMKSGGPSSRPNNVKMGTVDERLSACFQAVCCVMGNLHRAKIIQNFAAAAFHLCYLLRVFIFFCFMSFF
jgi:hypothetical protein